MKVKRSKVGALRHVVKELEAGPSIECNSWRTNGTQLSLGVRIMDHRYTFELTRTEAKLLQRDIQTFIEETRERYKQHVIAKRKEKP